jgi:superfamily I DNA/RNA helicase
MTISTFHSLGARILREHGSKLGLHKNYTIIDDTDRTSALKSVIRLSGRTVQNQDHAELAYTISMLKNNALDPADCTKVDHVSRKQQRLYTAYQQTLVKRQTVDFDDLLLLPLRLFERHSSVLRSYQKRYRFVCIDEYQDTNTVQMKLAALLGAPQNNIMVVGDDDQSIYSWRGANAENIGRFCSAYKNAKTVILDVNYRSTQTILHASHAVVQHNRVRTEKKIRAAAGAGDPIAHYRGDDEVDEAQWIAQTIKTDVRSLRYRYADHALLFRTNAMMRRFEEEMRAQNVPYFVQGSMSFFDRREIKDCLAYMRFFANPDDEMSVLRVLKVPDRGLSKTTLKALDSLASHCRISFFEALRRHNDATDITAGQHEKCQAFAQWVDDCTPLIERGALSEGLHNILNSCGYFDALKKAYNKDDTAADRIEHVKEMVHGLQTYEVKRKSPTLSGYLQELALQSSDKADDKRGEKDAVTFMTIHKAKGLEFPIVYLPGLDDSQFPSSRSVEEGNIEEERRLFYVAMTRAQRHLVCTYPNTRVFRKQDKKVTPCRFLFEIPPEYLEGPIGERGEEDYREFVSDFFSEMKQKFAQQQSSVPRVQ